MAVPSGFVSERALVFGRAADAYDRHRLGYPETVADLTLAYARRPVSTALEVGAGTGKATRLFAGRGVVVTACEPDPAMAALLRGATADLPVDVVLSTFEAYASGGRTYDLLFSASAWHWTDPAARWDLTAGLVRPRGTVALFGSAWAGSRLVDPALQTALVEVRREVIAEETRLTERRGASGTWWPGSELEEDDRFTDVQEHDVPRVVRRTRAEHLAVLGTVSAYLQLDADVREALLGRIGDVLPDEVEVDATVRLHLARRV